MNAEFIVGATSLLPFLEGKPKRVLVMDAEKAERLPVLIRRALRRYINGGEDAFEVEQPSFDYHELLDGLTRPVDVDAMTKVVEALPRDPDFIMDYQMDLQRVIAYLQGAMPINVQDTITGPINHKPNGMDLAKFRRQWQVAETPIIVLRHLIENRLVSDEVAALAAMYPQIYAMVQKEAMEAIVDAKAAKKSFKLGRKQTAGMNTLLQTASDSSLQDALQGLYKTDPEKPASPSSSSTSQSAKDMETTTQKLDR